MSARAAGDEPRTYEEIEAFIYDYDPEANEDRDNYTHRRLYVDQDTGIVVADTDKFERWLLTITPLTAAPTEQDPTA